MENANEYYENSIKQNKPSSLILIFFYSKYNDDLEGNIAIDLGCGSGNDTLFMLDKGLIKQLKKKSY